MKKIRWYTILILFLLAFSGWFYATENSMAQERDITLHNGQAADESDENLSEADLYQIGDTGIIHIDYQGSGSAALEGDTKNDLARTEFISSNTAVVRVDETGRYQVTGGGKAVVTAKVYQEDGVEVFAASCCFRCCGDATGAALEKTELCTYIINGQMDETAVKLVNMPDLTYYTFAYTSSYDGMDISCSLDSQNKVLMIYSTIKGTTTLNITINNKTFTLKVIVSEVGINKNSAVLTPKKKVTLKLIGYTGKVTWKTMKKKVATISAKGVVTAKKTGNTVVYAEINGKRVGCAVSVVTPKLKKVLNAAKSIAKGKYSQPRRMQKGYYDCSSLVWRSYKKIGKLFGDRSYAPVAASIAKYLFGKKKRISGGLTNKNIQSMKLRPGDLMFLTGAKNGRYKGIYHVEMFAGYQCEGFDIKGKPILGTLWANRPPNNYYGNPMGRP